MPTPFLFIFIENKYSIMKKRLLIYDSYLRKNLSLININNIIYIKNNNIINNRIYYIIAYIIVNDTILCIFIILQLLINFLLIN